MRNVSTRAAQIEEHGSNDGPQWAGHCSSLYVVEPPDWSRQQPAAEKKLMIVDNSAMLQEVLASAFSELLGLQNTRIIAAYNGQMGLRLITKELPDLIIFDLRMPLMNGLEMLGKLHQSEVWLQGYRPHLIALTGQIHLESIEQAMAIGVHHYYTKPFNTQALLEKVRCLLQD